MALLSQTAPSNMMMLSVDIQSSVGRGPSTFSVPSSPASRFGPSKKTQQRPVGKLKPVRRKKQPIRVIHVAPGFNSFQLTK